jgi:phage terminase small subunit
MDEDSLGPSMSALTEPQRAFVMAYAEQGGLNAAEAARRAGYGTNAEAQARVAHKMLKMPRILAAIREVADQRLRSGAVLAASVLVEIAQDKFHRSRYKAAVELLNRAGLVVEGVSRVIVEDHRTNEELERRIVDLSEKIGIDPARLLGRASVMDADFKVVDDDGIEGAVAKTVGEIDDWEDAQKEFDAMIERSET